MASITLANGGGNWGDTSTWVGAAVPTESDDVVCTASSGQLTINVAASCSSINFTNYTNTLTVNNSLTVGSSGTGGATSNMVLVSAMTITTSAGTPSLNIISNSANRDVTITSNGKTWPYAIGFNTHGFKTILADNWTIGGTFSTGSGIIFSGNSFNCQADFTISSTMNLSSTTTFTLSGTGTWSGVGQVNHSLTITGTYTISGNVSFGTGTLTTTAGTITIPQGSTLSVTNGGTIDSSNIQWENFNCSAGATLTFLSDFRCGANVTGTMSTINGPGIWYIGGNLSGNIGVTSHGTGKIVLYGEGKTWSPTGTMATDVDIIGKYTLVGTVNLWGGMTLNITGKILNNTTNAVTMTTTAVTLNVVKPFYLSALQMTTATTITGAANIKVQTVTITNGITITMDYFFVATDDYQTTVTSTNTSNYTISLNAGMNAISPFVKISNCTMARQGSLICTYRQANKGNNIGVIFNNQGFQDFPEKKTEAIQKFHGFGGHQGLRGWVTN